VRFPWLPKSQLKQTSTESFVENKRVQTSFLQQIPGTRARTFFSNRRTNNPDHSAKIKGACANRRIDPRLSRRVNASARRQRKAPRRVSGWFGLAKTPAPQPGKCSRNQQTNQARDECLISFPNRSSIPPSNGNGGRKITKQNGVVAERDGAEERGAERTCVVGGGEGWGGEQHDQPRRGHGRPVRARAGRRGRGRHHTAVGPCRRDGGDNEVRLVTGRLEAAKENNQ
jgi:hypothetical protein